MHVYYRDVADAPLSRKVELGYVRTMLASALYSPDVHALAASGPALPERMASTNILQYD